MFFDVFENRVDVAYYLVKNADEQSKNPEIGYIGYLLLIVGAGNSKVSAREDSEHDYYAVVDALHKYAAEHQGSSVPKGMEEGLKSAIEHMAKIKTLGTVTNTLCCEIEKEATGESSFNIDLKMLVDEWRRCVESKYDEFKNQYIDLDFWIRDTEEYFKKYGFQEKSKVHKDISQEQVLSINATKNFFDDEDESRTLRYKIYIIGAGWTDWIESGEIAGAQENEHKDSIEFIGDIRTNSWGKRVVMLTDPDGHLIEVAEAQNK